MDSKLFEDAKPSVLLIIPPFTQANTPYPSVMQLSGFLQSKGYPAKSFDLSLAVILRIFSQSGLKTIFSAIEKQQPADESVSRAIRLAPQYIGIIDPVIGFLQGKDPNLAYSLVTENFLPRGEAFARDVDLSSAFGHLGVQDRAKYFCSLLVDDLTNLIRKTISPHFGLSRYAEHLAVSPATFDPILQELQKEPNAIDEMIFRETQHAVEEFHPDVIGYTVPFPGNLLGALISSKFVKTNHPDLKIVFGGGYINTELRQLRDPRIFDYLDYLTFDDGEMPLLHILQNHKTEKDGKWARTVCRTGQALKYKDNLADKIVRHDELTAPSLEGINPGSYISMTEMLNPMHRLWSDGYWNKLAVAHGCYWHKCTFCDITLDYIKRYSPAKAATVVDWMEDLMEQSGRSVFHFTDEAAPPAALSEIAIEILRRNLKVSWWGNVRFEKAFTPDLCRLLAASGCVAVSGGLEVADRRLLQLINKGVTVEQVAEVCHNFQEAGIMVHSYLMYGFPTQTEQEIINSLELVRQFIQLDLFQSGFWHLFALTAHSPVAQNPADFNIRIKSKFDNPFATNDMIHENLNGMDYTSYTEGLNKALYNFMHGVGLEWEVTDWFDFKVPRPTVNRNLILGHLSRERGNTIEMQRRVLWLGTIPGIIAEGGKKHRLILHSNAAEGSWEIAYPVGQWLVQLAGSASAHSDRKVSFGEIRNTFPGGPAKMEEFMNSELWRDLRESVLLFL
ncbi:MAG: B12-binding domain-containing radical SAM protein [Calditrichia bacterium]